MLVVSQQVTYSSKRCRVDRGIPELGTKYSCLRLNVIRDKSSASQAEAFAASPSYHFDAISLALAHLLALFDARRSLYVFP